MNCNKCDSILSSSNISGYCKKCYPSIRKNKEAEAKFQNWLLTGDLGLSIQTTLRGGLREKLLEYYGSFCSICKIKPIWNGKPLVLILDHIDGDASNNSVDNLRFICPNCDSQLETYKSKNKNSARKFRKKE